MRHTTLTDDRMEPFEISTRGGPIAATQASGRAAAPDARAYVARESLGALAARTWSPDARGRPEGAAPLSAARPVAIVPAPDGRRP
jgi:hypothetical protein